MNPPEEWLIFENTHEAIVDAEMCIRDRERVGNLSEKYSSKWIDWLPDFSLLVALKWIALVLILSLIHIWIRPMFLWYSFSSAASSPS